MVCANSNWLSPQSIKRVKIPEVTLLQLKVWFFPLKTQGTTNAKIYKKIKVQLTYHVDTINMAVQSDMWWRFT